MDGGFGGILMENKEKALLDLFRRMDAPTRDSYLSHGRIALAAEAAAKRTLLRDFPDCTYPDAPVPVQGKVTYVK
jgi:hypothetical protein